MDRFWSFLKLKKVKKSQGLTSAARGMMLESIERGQEVGGAQMQKEFLEGGKVMEPHKMTFVGIDDALPHGETRLSRKQWPKSASPVVVDIVYQGLVFTVAKATILLGRNEKKVLIEAEGISRLSPTDDPDNNNPIQGKEMAISQAVKALHTRVMRHRRSLHHYRG